jgi:transposase
LPDKIKQHLLWQCPSCQTSLISVKPQGILKRQVFDIPQPKLEITEHQTEIKTCPCCHKKVIAEFPHGIHAPGK